MEKELYIYEKRKASCGREYEVRRRAKKNKCWECGIEWLIRLDRKSPIYCRVCALKGERNAMKGKTPWNKGKCGFDQKEYNRNRNNQLRWEKKKKLVEMMGNQCWKCGEKNLPICVWQWHHLEPQKKEIALSQILIKSWSSILEEAKKCVLICSNCHKIIHYGEEKLENGI